MHDYYLSFSMCHGFYNHRVTMNAAICMANRDVPTMSRKRCVFRFFTYLVYNIINMVNHDNCY